MDVSEPVDCEPLSALAPDQAPEAVQAVALLLDQVSVEALPEPMVPGAALIMTNGGKEGTVTVTDCVAEPPGPVHVSS